jgi:hypothetical protein
MSHRAIKQAGYLATIAYLLSAPTRTGPGR